MSRAQALAGRSIVLTGFMGTGKSTVGRLLAARLGADFVDTDLLITHRHGPIPEIFATRGEEAFRQMERDVAVEIGGRTGQVVSTGGRMLLDPANVESLCRGGRVVCLWAEPEEIIRRLTGSPVPRPLLRAPDPVSRIRELLAERESGYRRFAQIRSDSRPPSEIMEELLRLVAHAPRRLRAAGRTHLIGAAVLPLVRDLAGVVGRVMVIADPQAAADHRPCLGPVAAAATIPADDTRPLGERVAPHIAGARRPWTVILLGGVALQHRHRELAGQRVVGCPTTFAAMTDPDGPDVAICDLATLQTDPDAPAGRPTPATSPGDAGDAILPGHLGLLQCHVVEQLRTLG